MPISYQRRREIWLEMAKEFPSPLDKKVALRNIRKVANLSSKQQKTLAQAVRAYSHRPASPGNKSRRDPPRPAQSFFVLCIPYGKE